MVGFSYLTMSKIIKVIWDFLLERTAQSGLREMKNEICFLLAMVYILYFGMGGSYSGFSLETQALVSIFKTSVTVFHYTEPPNQGIKYIYFALHWFVQCVMIEWKRLWLKNLKMPIIREVFLGWENVLKLYFHLRYVLSWATYYRSDWRP